MRTFRNVGKYLFCILLAMWTAASSAEPNRKPFVIPELKSWTGAEGMFTPSGRIAVKGDKEMTRIADAFAQDYHALTGKTLKVIKGSGKAGDFVLVK